MEIIFATKNKGKQHEILQIMEGSGIDIIFMQDTGCDIEIVEDGVTFEENAIKKAQALANALKKPAMADDSGLEIDALGGAPGVYSARYMGEDTPYEIKNGKILEMLKDIPYEGRTARFVCVIAFAKPDGLTITAHASMEGFVAFEAAGENGFGYDPIFYLPEYGATSAQLKPEEKNAISHRGKALRLMREKLAALID